MRNGSEIGLTNEVDFRTIDYPVNLILPHSLSLVWDDHSQGILIEWIASVDTYTSFIISRNTLHESVNIATVSSTIHSFLDQQVSIGEPLGYVIKTIRDDKVIGISDPVLFTALDYLKIPLAIDQQPLLIDIFSQNERADLAEIRISLYDMSGRRLQKTKQYTWEEWIAERSIVMLSETLVVWKAELLTKNNNTLFVQGKHFFTK